MEKVELLLPAGNEECLRSAVNNGADAVYLGLDKFNARQSAANFDENNIASAISYCHNKNVKVYVAFNTLVKNSEIEEYFDLISIAEQAGADAAIIQDPCFVQIIKKNFPKLKVHLSTQATVANSYSVPEGVDRVILARELSIEEIKGISQKYEAEIFVHGALCISYSGQCLFSSVAGGRSGNRGMCAQPCRRLYNNKYALSTMDLCMLDKIPELIKIGVSCFKVEGRMRSPLYVQTVARIYRRAIDSYYSGRFSFTEKDISDLKIVFNREFTSGFAFNRSILDTRKPMNRGLYIGAFFEGKLKLKEQVKIGDGIGIWKDDKVNGYVVTKLMKKGIDVISAEKGDIVEINTSEPDKTPVYKTSSVDMVLELGEEIEKIDFSPKKKTIMLPKIAKRENKDSPKIFVKSYSLEEAVDADAEGAAVIYYDLYKKDCAPVKKRLKNARFFVSTPRILSDKGIKEAVDLIAKIKPDGVLVGNRGLLEFLGKFELHLDYSFNAFNDIDLSCYPGIPIISPELNFEEVCSLENKNFIVLAHGDIVLMATKENLSAPEMIDEEGRHFKVIKTREGCQILNTSQIGLFSKVKEYQKNGINYFYIDTNKGLGKLVRVYSMILKFDHFDDRKYLRGYTTGHFSRGVN